MAPHVSMPHHHPLSLPSFPFLLLLFLSLSLLCVGWSTGGEEAGVVRPERRRKSVADDGLCGGDGGGNVGQGTGAASPAHARRRTSGPRLSQQGGEPGAVGAQRHGGRRRLVERRGHPVLLLFFFFFFFLSYSFCSFPPTELPDQRLQPARRPWRGVEWLCNARHFPMEEGGISMAMQV